VNFTDITSVSVPVSWSWNFGDGGVSVQQNPSHTYALGGTYIVILIVTNSAGCSDTITKPVIVNTVPTPLFSANSTCQGTITSFTDLSTDAVPITAWYYNFADGNSSFSQNPNYIYAAAGVYNVSLTVTNISGCDSTVVIPVSVNVFPQAIYTVDTVCIGTPTTFTDSSAGLPTQWTWNFGDGTSSTVGPVISHVYSAAGTFLTSLTVSSGAGCTHTSFQIVVVRSDVQAGITAANAICENNILLINDNSIVSAGFILSQTWDFGDGSAQTSTLNTSHVYPAAGTYVITHVVVSDGGCSSTAYDTVVVNPLPSAAFTVANTCQNQLSSFIDASIGSITSWSWNFGDGGTANVQNPTHVYSTSGGFNATLVVITNTGCSDTVTRPITIFIQPTASFTSNVVCWGDTTVFVNTSTPNTGIIVASFWNFGDGFTSTLNNPTHVFVTQNSSFNVLLSVITDNGCVDTVLQNVNTHPLPAFNFGPQQMSGCEDFVALFTDNSTVAGGTIVNWLWNFGDGNLTFTPNPTHVYDTPGNYYVSLTLTSSYGCVMNNTLNFPILVYPKPIAAFSTSPNSASVYEPNIQLNDESIGATMWDWDLGDNHTSIFQNPYHTYPDTGVYNVTQIVINQFGCRDTVQHPISIKGESNIYIPNAFTPNSNGLNDVFAPKLYGVIEFKMSIFDRWGNEIFSTEDMQEGWNGRYKGTGEIVQQDVYVYKIITKDLLRDHHQYIGSVTVVR
ncbi:MAG: PKD domain-containing protein, partial [Bacteroidia bacterium]|nr:PKD domain-containing protein [Bacteroidia bacterium]